MIQLLSTPAYTPPYLTHQRTAMLVQVLSPTTVFVLPFPTSLSEEASLSLHIYFTTDSIIKSCLYYVRVSLHHSMNTMRGEAWS